MEINVSSVTWVLIGAALVYFMQAGFALCEAGLTRAKNTGNILMKNMMDFCIGTPCFWLVGFGIMFAGTGPLIGGFDPMIRGAYTAAGSVVPQDLPLMVYVIFQTVFCATAATMAVSDGLPRFRGQHLRAHGRRRHRLPRRMDARPPHRQIRQGRQCKGDPRT